MDKLVLHNQPKQPTLSNKKHAKQVLINLAKTAAIQIMPFISMSKSNRVCLRNSALALICFRWKNPKSKKDNVILFSLQMTFSW